MHVGVVSMCIVVKFPDRLEELPQRQQQRILDVSLDSERLDDMPVNEYVDLFIPGD